MNRVMHIPTEDEPVKKMGWLIQFRWQVSVCTLFIVLVIHILKPGIVPLFHLLGTIAGLCICNLFFYILLRYLRSTAVRPKRYEIYIHPQLMIDLLFLTTFLHFMGGLETPLFFFYLIYVSISTIFFSKRVSSLLYAGIASFLYLSLLVLEWQKFIPHYNLSGFRLPFRFQQPIHIFTTSFTLTITAFLTAYFVSTIVSKLRERERELLDASLSCEVRAHELAKLNARLEELDKTRAQFIYLVTHELRAPISAIQSYLRLILEGYVPPERHREIIQKSEQQALKQLALIADLLQLAKLHETKIEAKLELVDVAEMLEEVSDLMSGQAKGKNILFNIQISPGVPLVEADKEHIKQLWMNLISNSIKYTNPGGMVTVSLGQDSDRIVGTVHDTGVGIAAEDIPHIFDNFYRAKNAKTMERQGTGLGLSIVKRILDTYDGRIDVESELGHGSKFTFTLPARRERET